MKSLLRTPGTASRTTSSAHPRRRRKVLGTATIAAALAGSVLAAGPASAATQQVVIGGTPVSVRDCYHPTKQPYPSTNCTYQATLEAGLHVTLVCQTAGQGIGSGNDYYWDYVLYGATGSHGSGEGYVSDWYVNTNVPNYPYRDYNVPLCTY